MQYEKPSVVVYDEKVLEDIELQATSKCHCTMGQSRALYFINQFVLASNY